MQKHSRITGFSIAILLACAGTICVASEPPQKRPDNVVTERSSSGTDMRTAKWLNGRSIRGSDGKSIADVKDLLLDRGSGRVEYVIVKTDAILGLGGHMIAIPYEQFDWDAAKDSFTLASTKEQLQSYPEYTPERWNNMVSKRDLPSKGDDSVNRNKTRRDNSDSTNPSTTPRDSTNPPNTDPNAPTRDPRTPAPAPTNPNSNTPTAPARPGDTYPANPNSNTPTAPAPSRTERDDYDSWQQAARRGWDTSDRYKGQYDINAGESIEGTVTRVERVFDGEYGQDMVVTVAGNDGVERRVVLGPSWFVSGADIVPVRGDKVTMKTYIVNGKERTSIASNYRSGDHQMVLRDSEGNPAWSNERFESSNQTYDAPYYRYVLASKLKGAKIDCRGQECGKVSDIIIDRASGNAAYVAIDPNVNFLGVGDSKRLVPWNIATIGLDGIMRIDATKEMVLASPTLPSDTTKLNTLSGDVYQAYDVPAPKFSPRDRGWDSKYSNDSSRSNNSTTANNGKSDSWKADGPIIRGIDRDSMKTITGKVVNHQRVTFAEGGIAPGSAIVVRADGGSDETILMGPATTKASKTFNCKPGDTVTVDVVRTTVNGKQYWLARSFEFEGSRTTLLDDSNNPSWEDR